MLFLILAVLAFLLQNLCCKEFGRRFPETIAMQCVMVAVSTLIVAAIMAATGGMHWLRSGEWGVAAAFGFWFVVTLASMTLAINYGHMGITLLIQNSSLIVPTLYSVAVWGERFTLPKAAGTALILAMLALSALGGGSAGADEATQRRWNRRLWIIFTALAFTGDSMLSILQGYMALGSSGSTTFTLWTSLFSAAFAALLYLLTRRRQPGALRAARGQPKPFWLYCAGIGVGTAGGNSLSIVALTMLPGIILYPLRQGSVVLLMWFAGVLLYHEKVNRTGWWMLATGIAGMVLLNL